MMSPPRRPLALILLALLLIPALAAPFLPRQTISRAENRVLAPAPTAPRTLEDWRGLPKAIDAFVGDHFGFREPMMQAGGALKRKLGGEVGPAEAVDGRDGRMFLSEGLLRSTGQEVDPARVADYAAFVCAFDARLRAQGIRMVFGLGPSPAGVFPEAAPEWALPVKQPGEYEMILQRTRACGVATVDLKAALIAAKGTGQLYRTHDSHWSLRGSLLAYDRMVEALGRSDWVIAPETLKWRVTPLANGDLPRLAGRDPVTEDVEIHGRTDLPPGAVRTPLADLQAKLGQPFVVETGRPGPGVLVIGDSFTADPMPPYFAPFVGRVAWIHQDKCGFDWRVIERVKPDYVVLLPAEREAGCRGRPLGWPN